MKLELSGIEFAGPIELLLSLIEKRKLAINDISLSTVTDEYLKYLATINESEHPVSERIHFVYVASTLALIKSKSLLPNLDLTDEEETDISTLKKRLELYRQYQQAGDLLKKEIYSFPQFYTSQDRKVDIVFQPHEGITQNSLEEALRSVIREIPELPQKKQEGYIKIAVHIEEIMDSLIQRVEKQQKVNFESFLLRGATKHPHPKQQKVYTVVSFLALLEVVRNKGISVQQEGIFSDITVTQ